MRIAIGGFKQETNTFSTVPTTLKQFEDFQLLRGQDVISTLQDTNTEIGGFIDVCREMEYTMLPTLASFAISGGPLTAATYTTLRDELLQRLAAAQPVDAVLLSLHGAMVAEDEDDPDGATLQAVRQLVGPQMPLVVSLDLHANITQRYLNYADVLVGFKTCPHIDQRDTGRRAARILARWLAGDVQPVMAYKKIPMVTPASTHVHYLDGPFKWLMEAAHAAEAEPGVLSASAFTVQPWLDIPQMGFATVAVTDNNARLGHNVACRLANLAWAERHAFMDIKLVPPDEAIRQALAQPTGPVILSDLADGTGAGSPGDATAMIAALLKANPSKPALVWLFDPEVAAAAAKVGVGGEIEVMAGGKRDNVYNRPVQFTGTVTFAQPATFQFGGRGYTGITMDMGLSVVLRHNNIHLLVTSNPVLTVDPALYRAAGLEPTKAQIVVVKSHLQFRAGYDDMAQEIILLDSPGMSSDHLTNLHFERINRPLFPFDANVEYTCETDAQ